MGKVNKSCLPFAGQSVEVQRKKCRGVILHVRPGGAIWVSAPTGVADGEILQILERRSGWLEKAVARQAQRCEKTCRMCEGELFWYLGEGYRLQFSADADRIELDRRSARLLLPAGWEEQRLKEWYRERAQELFVRRVELWSARTELVPAGVRVKEQKSRYGSCGIHGDIWLNWRLVMEPTELVDSVILHELCHLKQRNHGPRFWELVAKYDPAYREHRAALNNHAGQWNWQ